MGPQAAMADDGGRLGSVEFAEPLPQRVERDVAGMVRAEELQLGAFVGVAQVDHLVAGEIGVRRQDRGEAVEVVHRRKRGHVQRVLGGTEGRRVG